MERFLNYHDVKDNDLELVRENKVVEEISLVTIIDDGEEEDDSRIDRKYDEVLFETHNDLQNEGEKRKEQVQNLEMNQELR